MFDEMFPGMGMMGMYGMNPMMMGINPAMFGGMQQYRQPGADIFSNMGIMNPQQQMFQQVEMRNMLEQQQFAREQQMLAMRNMSMNMGANAAQVGSGFAGPMLMGMGGLQNGQMASGVQGLTNALINRYGQSGGMTPMGPQAAASQASQIDPTQIIAAARAKYPDDPGRAYTEAGQQMIQLGKASGNDMLIQGGVRAMDQGNKMSLANQQTEADTAKSNAQAGEATARKNSVNAELNAPQPLGRGYTPGGQQYLAYRQYNQQSGQWDIKKTGEGIPMSYVLPQTPGDMGKNVGDYQQAITNAEDSQQRLASLRGLIKNGAAQGWTADMVGGVNDVIGTIQQLSGVAPVPADAKAYLDSKFGDTFQNWATRTEVSESQWSDLTMGLAGVYAHGQRISNVDINRAERTLGESIGNPKSILAVLDSVQQRMSQHIDNLGNTYSIGGTQMYRSQIGDLQSAYHKFSSKYANDDNGDAVTTGQTLTYDPSTGTFK